MSFAWVLALPCGKRVVTCAGSVYGFRESSYRSEGYGVLSAVRFVFHLFTFCGCVPKWRYEYMADNKGLLTAILQDSKYTEAFPNTTLEADWDVRNEIKATFFNLWGWMHQTRSTTIPRSLCDGEKRIHISEIVILSKSPNKINNLGYYRSERFTYTWKKGDTTDSLFFALLRILKKTRCGLKMTLLILPLLVFSFY
jgi:hypothetical protein